MASTEADVFDRLGRGLSSLGAWIDKRFPMTKLIKEHATEYYASKNFNIWYGFGVIATVVLVMQLVTGIFLTMNYKPCLLYTSPSPRDTERSRMPSSA